MIIALRNFRDEEYFIPKEILAKAGMEVVTASTQRGIAVGSGGGETKVDLLLSEADIKNFDGVVFIGGQGAHQHLDNEQFHQIAREAVKEQKLLAAICIAPAILAKAGVLDRKKATVWSSVLDKSAVKILASGGAIYQPDLVVQDGNIITANGQGAAREFGKGIIKAIRLLAI